MASGKKRHPSRHKRKSVTGNPPEPDQVVRGSITEPAGRKMPVTDFEAHYEDQGARRIAEELGWPDPAMLRTSPAAAGQDLVARLGQDPVAVDPELAAKLSRGLSPEELADPEMIQRIAEMTSGAAPGQYVFGPRDKPGPRPGTTPAEIALGGPGMPAGMQPGDILAEEQPLGYTETGVTLPDGSSIEPGAKVWRAAMHGTGGQSMLSQRIGDRAELPAIDLGRPAPLGESRTAYGDFAAAQVSGPELIVTDDLDAVNATDADFVIEDLDPDDPEDSGRILTGSPEQVRAYHERAEKLARRARKLIPGPDESALVRTFDAATAVRVRTGWVADEVLDAHSWLTRHYRNPNEDLGDYLAYHIRNSVDQDHRTQSMFWPVDLRQGADVPQGQEMARIIARGLGDADTYQVTAPMCRKMRDEWDARPGELLILDEGILPAPAGFAWLDAPWLTELSAGYWLPVRAVSWERTVTLTRSEKGTSYGLAPGQTAPVDAVRIVLWLLIADDVAFGRWKGAEARAGKVANRVGRLVPQQIALLPFGVRISMAAKFRTNGRELMGVVHTLWTYLGMELARSRPVQAAAPAVRQRARRSLRHNEVHVITLRKIVYVSDPQPHFPKKVDWSCRWWVNEFCRHIDYYEDKDSEGRPRRHKPVAAGRTGYVTDDDHDICAVCLANGQSVRIALVHSFAKGPPDKPFRTPSKDRTVHRLSR